MNTLGRVFVLATFSLSLFFLALAIGVYANHIPWGKDKGGKAGAKSIVEGVKEKIDAQGYARDRAVVRYQQAFNTMGQNEQIRAARQKFYAAKLDLLHTGKDALNNNQAAPSPIRDLEFNKLGEVEPRMIGPKVLQERGADLLPMETYRSELAAAHKRMLDEETEITKLQKQLNDLTIAMQGDDNNKIQVPGLIAEKALQIDARNRAIAEQEAIKPILTNRYGEAVILLRREQGLKKRLEQLEKSGAAVGLNK